MNLEINISDYLDEEGNQVISPFGYPLSSVNTVLYTPHGRVFLNSVAATGFTKYAKFEEYMRECVTEVYDRMLRNATKR